MKKIVKKNKKTDKGFHLKRINTHAFSSLELILVIAIVTLVGLTSVPFLSRFFVQTSTADTYNRLLGEFRKAQTYAMAGKQNGPWGVYYGTVAGSKQIILYQGSSYATHTNTAFDENYTVNPNVNVTGFSDINFAQVSGTPSAATTITISGTSNTTRTIQIDAQGIVNYAQAGPTNTPVPNPTATPTPTITPTPSYTPPSGPPVFSSSSSAPKSTCTPTCSWSQTITSASNRLLLVAVGSATTPTSVTYGGSDLTMINQDCGGDCSSMWYLVNPPVGTNTIAVNGGGPVGGGSFSFSNVNQLTPVAGHQESTQSGTSMTVNVSGTNTNVIVVDGDFHLATGSVTPGSGQTMEFDSGTSFTNYVGSLKAGVSIQTPLSWTGSTGGWYETAVVIN